MDAKVVLVAAVMVGGLGGYAWSSFAPASRAPTSAVHAAGSAIVLHDAAPPAASEIAESDREWAARGVGEGSAQPPSDARSAQAIEQSATYSGCNEVRAARKAPLYAGQPGYRPEMDGDGDGVACEPIRR